MITGAIHTIAPVVLAVIGAAIFIRPDHFKAADLEHFAADKHRYQAFGGHID